MTLGQLAHPDEVLPLGDTLDVRRASEFRTGHFASAVSCPLDRLGERLHLLPDRSQRLWVFGADDEIEAAVRRLGGLGFTAVSPHPAASPFASPRDPVAATWTTGGETARLWRATPFLARLWPALAERRLTAPAGVRGAPVAAEEGAPMPRALDVACGSGRDAVWLALGGFRVVGLDALADALVRARARTASAVAALGARVAPAPAEVREPSWSVADLEAGVPVRDGSFDLVVCARFLHRPSFPWIVAAMAPGGSLVYTTFTRRQLAWGKPTNPAHLLEDGELRALAENAGLEVLAYEEASPPGGPALAALWAAKPAPGPGS